MAILIIYFDQPAAHGASELCSKHKISAALCLGFTGSLLSDLVMVQLFFTGVLFSLYW